jgi:hypothetical protein
VIACDMVELVTRAATEAEWDELEARSGRFSFGQERLEVIEARAAAAARRGALEDARRHLARALADAAGMPTVMGARLQRRLAEL